MKFSNRSWIQLLTGVVIFSVSVAVWITNTPEDKKHLIIMSDVHLSSPIGRWVQNTEKYRRFIESIEKAPDIIFHVGDFIDNVASTDSGVTRGGRDNWMKELEIYKSIHKVLQYKDVKILHSYGTGHDFWSMESLKEAELITGIKRKGIKRWGGINLVWITTKPGSFSQTGPYDPVMEKEEYEWLNNILENNNNSILLFHVPIKTTESIKHAQFGNKRDLTIPLTDPLYDIISKHKNKLLMIVNGHIHKPLRSKYSDIPVYICPFTPSGCFCELEQTNDDIKINPINCGLESERISLLAQ